MHKNRVINDLNEAETLKTGVKEKHQQAGRYKRQLTLIKNSKERERSDGGKREPTSLSKNDKNCHVQIQES